MTRIGDEPWHNPGCHTWLALIAVVIAAGWTARRKARR